MPQNALPLIATEMIFFFEGIFGSKKTIVSIDRNELFCGRMVGKIQGKKKGLTPLAKVGLDLNTKCMRYCTQTDRVGQGFWLHLRVSGDGIEIPEYDLPTPNHYERKEGSNTYTVAWLIDGYFGTKKSKAYLNDIIARLSMGAKIVNRLDYAPKSFLDKGTRQLRAFGNLPSLPREWRERNLANHPHAKKDAIFWAIKQKAIEMIRITGIVDHDILKAWAFDLFIHTAKDRSTLRAKVKSVFEWYQDRDWKIDGGRIHTMSKTEGAKKATAIRQARVKGRIQTAINVLKLYGSKITAEAVAKEAKIARGTAQKYLKQLKEQGAI